MEPKRLTKPRNSSQIGQLCRMIEVCAKLGARTLTYGDLRVEFGPETGTLANFHHTEVPEEGNTDQSLVRPTEFSLADKDLLEDMHQSQLLIDDPGAFEDEIVQYHLRQGAINETTEDRRAQHPL